MLKNILLTLAILTYSYSGKITVSGNCACNSAISSAFTGIDDFIVDENLSKIDKSLSKLLDKKDIKIQKIKDEIKTLEKLIKQNKNDVVYLESIAFLLEQEIQIRKNHKNNNSMNFINKIQKVK